MHAEPNATNFDESNVPPFTLPDPLVLRDGSAITNAAGWPARRAHLLELFRQEVYGRSPPAPLMVPFSVTSTDPNALGGLATRKEITLHPTGSTSGPAMHLLLYVPKNSEKSAPVFMGLNFRGNQSIHADPGITFSANWLRHQQFADAAKDGPLDAERGSRAHRWPVEKIVSRGYALATAFYGDLEPDFPDGWQHGLRGTIPTNRPPAPEAWGAIGAWAWGLSRALDVIEKVPELDARRVAVLGHSRLGKTALWAGAQDERFALIISNNSGCGGASLSRRNFGESVTQINTTFPHWFCGNFKRYNDRETDLPVDQHELIALLAPRPVYVASAAEDLWCDPKGEFLSALHAEPVYRLLSRPGLGVHELPPLNQSIGDTIGYHIRSGKHDVTAYDWDQYLAFADRHLPPHGP